MRTRGEEGLTLRAVAHELAPLLPRSTNDFAINRRCGWRSLSSPRGVECGTLLVAQPRAGISALSSIRRNESARVRIAAHVVGTALCARQSRPGRAWLLTQLAARFGGEPKEYARAFDAFFLLCHGTATLLAVSDDQQCVRRYGTTASRSATS